MDKYTKNALLIGFGGLIVGAAAGLLLAPQSGRRTRAMLRDKTVKYSHDAARFTGKKSRHVANKLKGYAHDIRHMFVDRLVAREIKEEPITTE